MFLHFYNFFFVLFLLFLLVYFNVAKICTVELNRKQRIGCIKYVTTVEIFELIQITVDKEKENFIFF